jgi:hypothetical protein
MANDNKQTKAAPAPKTETAAKDKSASGESSSKTQSAEGASKTERSKSDAAPANYSRGEGQKPVTEAYRENWNLIFAKNSKRKKR